MHAEVIKYMILAVWFSVILVRFYCNVLGQEHFQGYITL